MRVYDTGTFQRIASLRAGNTPVDMAITSDQKYLIVRNDNSQIANVYELDAMQASEPIVLAPAAPGRSHDIACGDNGLQFAMLAALSRLGALSKYQEQPQRTPRTRRRADRFLLW